MQTQEDQAQVKPKSNKMWLIIGGVVLACCCIVVIAALVAGPAIQNTFNSITNSLQSVNPSGIESSTSEPNSPSSGPAEGGRGDTTLKTDVWNSIVNFYATNQS